jgi:hypothetical protein
VGFCSFSNQDCYNLGCIHDDETAHDSFEEATNKMEARLPRDAPPPAFYSASGFVQFESSVEESASEEEAHGSGMEEASDSDLDDQLVSESSDDQDEEPNELVSQSSDDMDDQDDKPNE